MGRSLWSWFEPRTRRRFRGLLPRLAAVGLAAVLLEFGAGEVRAAATVDLDQWATLSLAWQNGNINGSNSRYPEGGVVPFRLAMEGLTPGNHEVHLNYDFTAAGHKAYDFLATWNATNAAGQICSPSGGAISSMCPALPASTTAAFPSDGYVADGLSVAGAQAYSGSPRRLTLWGGTITSIGVPVHSGSPAGNSSVDVVVRFRTTGSAALLAWGGHLAQSSYWNVAAGGSRDGASLVSGAPWHMRTLQLDGSGNKNQDRSISPSAIVGALPPAVLATPPPAVVPPGVVPSPPNTALSPVSGGMSDPGRELGAILLAVVTLLILLARPRPGASRGRSHAPVRQPRDRPG